MTQQETAVTIRCMVTALVIAEYKLIQIKDDSKEILKKRVNEAIRSCRKVQDYFLTHPQATQETRDVFRQQFAGDEMVLLSELLELCFGLSEESLEDIISSIKSHLEKSKTPEDANS